MKQPTPLLLIYHSQKQNRRQIFVFIVKFVVFITFYFSSFTRFSTLILVVFACVKKSRHDKYKENSMDIFLQFYKLLKPESYFQKSLVSKRKIKEKWEFQEMTTNHFRRLRSLAAERSAVNRKVGGSIPPGGEFFRTSFFGLPFNNNLLFVTF